jgi:hypothetical protein
MWFLRRRASRSGDEAKKALEEAEKALRTVQERGDLVTEIAQDAIRIRERNHFAEQLEELVLQRRRPLHE